MRRFFVAGSFLLVLFGLVVYAFSDNIWPAEEVTISFNKLVVMPNKQELQFKDKVVLQFRGRKGKVIQSSELLPAEYEMQLAENVISYGIGYRSSTVRFNIAQRRPYSSPRVFLMQGESQTGLPLITGKNIFFDWKVTDAESAIYRRYEKGPAYPVVRFKTSPEAEIELYQDWGGLCPAYCIKVGGHFFQFAVRIPIQVVEVR